MTEYELTENSAETISISLPRYVKRLLIQRHPKKRSDYITGLIKKDLGIQ